MKHIYKSVYNPLRFVTRARLMLIMVLLTLKVSAQVSPPVAKTTRDHNKQVIGYITQWDAWKEVSGLVPKGGYNQLNLDYSQYTILNFSFFGVAKDGSLHSGDYRNKNIYQVGQVQEPNKLINDDIYSSWDMYILYGQLDVLYYVGTSGTAYDMGYRDVSGGWQNINTGATGTFPLSVPKTGGKKGLIALAHEKGVKAMASVGGWSMCKHYPEMAADPTKRAKFINDAKKLIAMGFDGIDLDWEYPNNPGMNIEHYGTQDYTNFAIFIEELRAAIGPDKLITSCFSASPSQLQGFDWPRIQRTLNFANIMTYDINGGWSNKAGHNAPLYDYPQAEFQGASLNAVTQALRSMGVDLSKVNLGSPFYGRGVVCSGNATLGGATTKVQVTVQPDGPISTCADFTNWPADLWDATPPYSAILQKLGITHIQDTAKTLTANGWTKQWDDVAKVPYLTNGKYFLSYDDKRSIAEKAKYIKNNGLAGVIIWQVYQDMLNMTSSIQDLDGKLKYCPNTISPLVNTINATFADGSTPQNQAPTVSITSPANNASFTAPATIAINANAADADGTIVKVEFFNGTTKLGEDLTAPYSYTWSNVANGSYSLTAKTTDDKGAATTSTAVTITSGTVQNQLPTVSITSPSNNTTITGAPVTVSITANAADTDGSLTKVEFYNGTTLLGTDTTSPYNFSWAGVAAGTYTLTAKATDNVNATTTSSAITITVTGTTPPPPTDKVIVGYWHNWDLASAPYIKLRDVNSKFNVIQVAFAEAPTDNATLSFAPAVQSDAEFISDMGILKQQGRKVLISIGGQNGIVVLNDATAKTKFVTSLKAIVDKYGFDGVDIDLEGGTSLGMDANDKNPNAPTTPKIVNLIAAVKEVVNYYKGQGKDFWLTMAPETYYVQVGYGATYGAGNVGAYLPIINGLRNELTFVHPQYYNTGSVTALDGVAYNQATPDFSVSMSELLLQGFPVSGTSYTFAPLREDQVAIGLPAAPGAAGGGYMAPTDVTKALNYLVKGQSFGGQYTLRKPAGYPNVRGIMTWSVNWDKVNNGGFSNAAYDFFFGTTTPNNPPTVSVSANPTSATAPATITLSSTATDSDGSITKVEFYNGATLLSTDTASPYSYSWTGVVAGTYTVTAKAYDNSNASTTSTAVTVTVTTSGNQNPTVSISSPANGATFTAPASITINATAADADGTISKVEFYNGTTLLGTDTSTPYSYAWTGVAAGTYSLTAKAYDNNNASATSSVVSVTVNATGGCSVAAWDPAKAYVNGDQASYEGIIYQAKWWTQNNVPSTNTGEGKPWAVVGPCGGGNQSPTAAISSPTNGAAFTAPASVSINATAADTDGTISKVEFYNGTTLLGTDTSSPYSYSWTGVAAGSYSLTVKAYDNNNAVTTSSAVVIAVNTAGNQSPTVAISSPANGASFTAPASITINATATDADGTISKVEFYNGSTLLGTDTSSPYSYSWTSVAAGSYSITAKAFDNNNASTTSSAVSVTVNAGTGGYDCSTIESYQPYPKVYNQGDLVKYNGVVYQSQSNALYNVTPGTAEHWWKTMGNCNAGTQALAAPAQDIVTNLYPNPATGSSVTADVTVVAAEKVIITVTSTQTMQQYFNKTYTASTTGTESFTVDISNLPVGTFVLQVTTEHGQSSKTIVRQ